MTRHGRDSNHGPLGQECISLTTEPKSRFYDGVVRDWLYSESMPDLMQILVTLKQLMYVKTITFSSISHLNWLKQLQCVLMVEGTGSWCLLHISMPRTNSTQGFIRL